MILISFFLCHISFKVSWILDLLCCLNTGKGSWERGIQVNWALKHIPMEETFMTNECLMFPSKTKRLSPAL